MKKVFLTLSVILITAMSVFAGGEQGNNNRYMYAKFTQNWFLDFNGTINFFQGSDFSPKTFSPLYGPHFGGSIMLGKMVSPTVSLRGGYDINPFANRNGSFMHKYVHLDAVISLCDLFGGYRNDRIYRLNLVGGFGLLGFDTDMHKYFITKSSALEYGANFGIMNSFRLSKSLDIHIDIQDMITKSIYDMDTYNPEFLPRLHNALTGKLGLTWFLGGRHFELPETAVADCSKQENRINELTLQVEQLQKDLADCRNNNNTVTPQPCDTIVKFVEGESLSYPFSIFFNKGSYDLRDGRDLVNLQEFANAAKQNGYKIVLRGTCDSATASSAFNQTLAENRCNKVKAELVKLGVDESNISIQPVGGVKELNPTEYDRRVLIQLSK